MPKVKLTDRLIRNQRAGRTQEDFWDESFSGGSFGVRVTSKGRKTFQLMYRAEGRLRRMSLGVYPQISLATARKEARKILGDVARGKDPARKKIEARRAESVEEFGQLYLERHAKRHKKPTSFIEDTRILEKYIYPTWRKRKARSIRRRDVIELLDDVAERGPVMANRVRALLSKMFNFAIARDLLEFNPVSGVPKYITEKPRSDFLNDDEIKALWTELDSKQGPTADVFKMILATAQRPGEVKQMRWDQIDFDEKLWRIPEEVAKNGREHFVPLTPLAESILSAIHPTAQSKWVFATHKGTPVKWLQSMTKRINKELAKSEEPVKFGPHMLRRTAATGMASIGVNRDVIAKVLNHKSADNTVTAIYDRYDRIPEMRRALERWGARLEQIVTGEPAKVVKIR